MHIALVETLPPEAMKEYEHRTTHDTQGAYCKVAPVVWLSKSTRQSQVEQWQT